MLAHIVNNSLFVILRYATGSGEPDLGAAGSSWITVAVSIALTAGGIILLRSMLTAVKTEN